VELIEFLLFLFDWGAILATHRILKQTLFNSLDYLIDGGKIGDNVKSAISAIMKSVPGLSDAASLFSSADAQINSQQRLSAAPQPQQGYSDANGVSGTMVSSKITEHTSPASFASTVKAANPAAQAEQIEQVLAALTEVLHDLVTAPPGDIGSKLLDIVRNVGEGIEAALLTGLDDALKVLNLNVKAEDLDIPFHIPFISELYKWITGDDLTLVDACCLALAVPTNIVYGEVTLVRHGHAGHFNDDAAGLPDLVKNLRSPALGCPDGAPATGTQTGGQGGGGGSLLKTEIPWGEDAEIAFGLARGLEIILGLAKDYTFAASPQVSSTRLNVLGILEPLCGIMSTVLWVISFGPRLSEWMEEHHWDEDQVRVAQDLRYADLGVKGFALVLVAFAKYGHFVADANMGIVGVEGDEEAYRALGDDAAADAAALAQTDAIDARVCTTLKVAAVARALACLGIIAESIALMAKGGGDKDAGPIAAFWFSQLSSVVDDLVEMPQFMFTKTYALTVGDNREYYEGWGRYRFLGRLASAAMQTGAILLETL
jgi:hypothetical protein